MPTCDLPTLTAGASCFNCLSQTEKQAAKIQFLALALKQLGGADYTGVSGVTSLRNAVVCLNCEPEPVLDSFDVAVAQNLALAVGAPANLTVAQIKDSTKLKANLDLKELHAMETLLRCSLKAYSA